MFEYIDADGWKITRSPNFGITTRTHPSGGFKEAIHKFDNSNLTIGFF